MVANQSSMFGMNGHVDNLAKFLIGMESVFVSPFYSEVTVEA